MLVVGVRGVVVLGLVYLSFIIAVKASAQCVMFMICAAYLREKIFFSFRVIERELTRGYNETYLLFGNSAVQSNRCV